ncbi:hypothetical protein RU03_26740 [Pseudomonas simiae]|uniref:hypothetical protein n=1 Tax=Pseudomonas TaxID=286 RepID=UPI0005AD1280|nr:MULTISPECIES: hypothetical protein [Pseudomonas]KIQ07323.1 hypothetical protein RU03_26740 [Pseudomonas simiae]
MIRELIEKAKSADKPGLIQILDELGVKADQRKSEDTLRSETLAGLQQALTDEERDVAGGVTEITDLPGITGTQAGEQGFTSALGAEEGQALIDNTLSGEQVLHGITVTSEAIASDLAPPDLDEEHAPAAVQVRPVNRLLRNANTGAEFVWTVELAKLSHMIEV